MSEANEALLTFVSRYMLNRSEIKAIHARGLNRYVDKAANAPIAN
jgi:hypothetical protein